MKFKKSFLIGAGVLTFLALMVLNVQLVQNPTGGEGIELTLVELSASAGGEGMEGGGYGSLLDLLLNLWRNLLYHAFGIGGLV